MIMPTNLAIDDLLEDADAFLFGYQDFSMNFPIMVDMEYIVSILPKLKEKKKQLFIALNKNFHNPELEKVTEIMKQLCSLHIDGILYYDVAIVQIKKENQLKIPLIWWAEHLTTNYATINYWQKHGIHSVLLSGEITKQEILEIKKHSNIPLITPIFGYLPMFVSERHEVKNYLNHFQLQDTSSFYYMEKEGKKYPLVDNSEGTFVYSHCILNGYQEYLEFKEKKIDYVLLNEFLIDRKTFQKVLNIFKTEKGNDIQIDNLCHNNTNKGFLYQETVYQVKQYE